MFQACCRVSFVIEGDGKHKATGQQRTSPGKLLVLAAVAVAGASKAAVLIWPVADCSAGLAAKDAVRQGS